MPVSSVNKYSFVGGEYAPLLYGRSDLERYPTSVRLMENFFPYAYGGFSKRPGTEFIAEVKDSSKAVRLIPFSFSVTQAYVIEVGDQYMRFYMDGGQIYSGGSPYEIATPYLEADIPDLKFTQSADTLIITHPDYAVRRVTRTGHTAWTISEPSFGSGIGAPTNVNALSSLSDRADCRFAVAAVTEAGEESVLSDSVRGKHPDSGHEEEYVTWTAVSGANHYHVYERAGTSTNGGLWGFIGWSKGTRFNMEYDIPFTMDVQHPPILEDRNPFDGTGNRPGCCCFFDQRLLFARTDLNIQTVYGSQIGLPFNFNWRIYAQESDAFEFTVDSQMMNEIRWLAPMNELLVGTAGAVFRMSPGAGNSTLTPVSPPSVRPQMYTGVAHLAPILAGNRLLFLDSTKSKIIEISENQDTASYDDTEVSLYAAHLFDGYEVRAWAYQRAPHSIVWAARNDGTLLGMTYYKTEKVYGWHRHTLGGYVEDAVSLPSDGGPNDVYLLVRRTVDGSTVRYVERLSTGGIYDGDPAEGALEDARYLDCALTYTGSPATVISGLDHLEGEEVVALADGFVVKGKTVSGGEIELDTAASVVHVGLPYTARLQTLDIDYESPTQGTTLDKKRRIASVYVCLRDTNYLKIGPTFDRLIEIGFRTDELPGEPTRLFTGEKEIILDAGLERQSRVCFEHGEPVPVTVLGFTARIEHGTV